MLALKVMHLRLIHVCRLFLISSLAASLVACLSSSTVSNNPVAVPTQLYTAPVEAQATDETTESTPPTPSAPSNDATLMNQLQSVDHALNIGQYEMAEQQLAQLTPALNTDPLLQTNLIILQTKLALLAGNPKQAMTWLTQLNPSLAPNPAQQHYLMQLRIQALYRTNHILLSALADIEDHSDNTVIWDKLMMTNLADLQLQQAQQAEPVTSGWLALALIAQSNANNFNLLQTNILLWQQKYPQHPANALLSLMNKNAKSPTNDNAIAVILPLTGSYATLGKNVQQGILAAYYSSPHKAQQRIDFFDSNADSIATIYQRIQENGDPLILGPLTKEDSEDLLDIAKPFPRIISLNYTSNNALSPHIEFGLSPEGEAQQVAELAWRQGKSRALIIAPQTSKGEQTTNAFIKTWSALGGQIIDRYNYASDDNFSKSISTLLGATDGQWRQHSVHTTLHLHITPTTYTRKDADMIFLSADPKTARQIVPFIKFYAGNLLKIFATSNVYSGSNNLGKDKDLNGLYFCDMPALLIPDDLKVEGNIRLYFLGIDAYLLAMQQLHLNTLPHFPLFGATGHLTVDSTQNIQRELMCAQFKDGRPAPLNTSS